MLKIKGKGWRLILAALCAIAFSITGVMALAEEPAAVPTQITVTPDRGQYKTAGESDPVLTYKIFSGGTDLTATLKDKLTGGLERSAGEGAGNYSIIQGTLKVTDAEQANYTVTFTTGVTFEIRAVPSADFSTASRINSAVGALSTASSQQELDAIAAAVRTLNGTEKKRLTLGTLEKLGDLYARSHGFSESVKVYYDDNFSSTAKMPDAAQCYGAAVAIGGTAVIEIDQKKSTGSTALHFEALLKQGRIDAPIVLRVALPSGVATSRSYYISSPDGRLPCLIERSPGENHYYAVFIAYSMGNFRLIPKSGSTQNDGDEDYAISSFWEDVIDDISRARRGGDVRVNVGKRTTMAAEVLRELEDKNVTLVLRRDRGDTIRIYGRDVRRISSTRDYYYLDTLAQMYNPKPDSSSSVPTSSIAPPLPTVSAPPAPAPAPPPIVAPAAPTPAAPPTQASAVLPEPEQAVSSEESTQAASSALEEDFEIVAEEVPDSSSEPKPQEQTGAEQTDTSSIGWFAAGTVLLSALLAGGITLVVWRCKDKRRL